MAENDVTITITSKDDSAAGFASSTARTKAYQALVDQTTRKEIAAQQELSRSYTAHERATRLLAGAEKVLGDHTEATTSKQGRLSRVLGGLGGMFSSLGTSMEGAVSSLPFVGSGLGAIVPAGSAALPVLAAVAAAFTAVLLSLGPLVAGLALITVGVAAFAAAAIPSITAVMTARQKLTAAEKAYDNATTKAQRVAALKAEKMATEGLTGAQKQLLHPMDQIAGQFHKLQKAVEPQVIRAFGSALDIIRKVMPALTPLAIAAGKALDKFLGNIDHWLSSGSGRRFIHWMETEGPKAIATFGRYLTGLIHIVGEVMYWWDRLGNDVIRFVKNDLVPTQSELHTTGHAFADVEHAIGNVVHAVGNGVHAFGNIVHAGGNVIHAMGNVAHAIANVVNAIERIAGAVGAAIGALGGLGSAVDNALGGIPGKVLGLLGLEHGGVVGAAQGGGPKGGWTQINERGSEIVRLPTGSMVYSAPDTQRMLGQGGGGTTVVLRLGIGRGHSTLDQALLTWLRDNVQVLGGGSVQVALGTDY